MEVKYWLEKWEKDNIGFHQSEFNSLMIKYFTEIKPGTVFVPFCGKSRDMLWFIEKSWKVLGVEASEKACRVFFDENKIRFEEKRREGFIVFESKKITLLCGDFFSLPAFELRNVTAVYDRAALIALPPEKRRKYADHMLRILQASTEEHVRILLISLEYAQEKVAGPPFSVDTNEINKLYGPRFKVRELEREEEKELPINNPKFKDSKIFEAVYWLTTLT